MIYVVPSDSGKPTVKSVKATVQDGSCFWENPIYETVKFNQDPKTGKVHERIYYFIVGTGSSKSGVVGEASIDFSNYAEATKVSLVSLPLKNSKTEAILHVSIHRIQESEGEREIEERENEKLHSGDHTDGTITTNSRDDMPFSKTFSPTDLKTKNRAFSGSDVTSSSSENSSGNEAPWELQINNGGRSGAPTPIYKDHLASWDWLGNPALESKSTNDSLNTSTKENFLRHEDSEDISIKKLKSEIAVLSRQAEMSELELQTLRKQIAKETKRGNDFYREIVCLKEEKDRLKANAKASLFSDGTDSWVVIEELKQELNHAKEINSNLQIQLRKTHESNSELILAVRDLDDMLEWKNKEILEYSRKYGPTCEPDSHDDEQKVLEDLVKEQSHDAKEAYLLDRQTTDLRGEIEIYEREKDELEMQFEQLALDYEIMKQSNHDLSSKLEQSKLQEQLKMQYEWSASDTLVNELETHIKNLENKLKRQSKDYTNSFAKISTLEAHAKSLEEELEKRAQGFEADLEALTLAKVEQEQRAIRVEETLKKIRWKNANTAERLQEEFRILSLQMDSTFQANEKLAAKAMDEADELRLGKSRLEELLRKTSEEQELVKGDNETRLHQLSGQVISMTNKIEQMQLEIEEKTGQLENQKKHAEDEIETLNAKNKFLLQYLESKKDLMHELEQMRMSIKEKELPIEQGNDERIELENRVILVKNASEEFHKELYKMRCLLKEKESIVATMQSEIDSIRAQCMELKKSQLQDEAEIEKLKRQVLLLRSDLKKREEALNSLEKKMKDGNKGTSKTNKPIPRASKEAMNLKERVKLLECQIKSKETDLEISAITFLDKETDLRNKIRELEGKLEVYERSAHFHDEVNEPASVDHGTNMISNIKSTRTDSTRNAACIEELNDEMTLLKEKNKSMEADLKEMQERYLDISLKFAEVEGERQQLIMKLRNLTNGNKSS